MDDDDDEPEHRDENEFVSDDAMMSNLNAIDIYRSYLTIFAGTATGILGATGLGGLALFLASYLFISLGILGKMGLDSQGYVKEKVPYFLFGNIGRYGLSFVLFWTLSYALVYIYDPHAPRFSSPRHLRTTMTTAGALGRESENKAGARPAVDRGAARRAAESRGWGDRPARTNVAGSKGRRRSSSSSSSSSSRGRR
eukprot:CAMPEP_0197424148 /NCGR_PEP_ID=MMETSP1170-20131217/24961_1 /TAXON_ID=54406 /ORGANISM="Sarcinochrysis sp, Strain CCMP770" /LENGTH=196 /DNA_ID=CAMNT_0042951621 /DNA_START=24 /DNA_END=611 /DNA_ORIENTATION=-